MESVGQVVSWLKSFSSDPWDILRPPPLPVNDYRTPSPAVDLTETSGAYSVLELAPATFGTRTSPRVAAKKIADFSGADAPSGMSEPPTRKPTYDEMTPEHQAIDRSLKRDYGYKSSDLPNSRRPPPLPDLAHRSGSNTNSSNDSLAGTSTETSRSTRASKRSATMAEVEDVVESSAKRNKRGYKRKTQAEIDNMTPEDREKYYEYRRKNNEAVDKTRAKKEKVEEARRQKEEVEKLQIQRDRQQLRLYKSTMKKLVECYEWRSIVHEKDKEGTEFNAKALARERFGSMTDEQSALFNSLRAELEGRNMEHANDD